jgi:hypothetical protein
MIKKRSPSVELMLGCVRAGLCSCRDWCGVVWNRGWEVGSMADCKDRYARLLWLVREGPRTAMFRSECRSERRSRNEGAKGEEGEEGPRVVGRGWS